VIVPTIGVPFRAAEYTRAPARIDEAANVRLLAGEDAVFVIGNAKKDLVSDGTARVLTFAPTVAKKLRELRALGLPVAVGSDAGSTMHWQANAIWWEMEAWRAAGVAPRDVLTAATEHGARVLSWPDVGHLRPGARADFVLYRGNVEDGAFDMARVSAVGKGGVVFAPF
jgi:imidazolonepropionase-like amidohydrolase